MRREWSVALARAVDAFASPMAGGGRREARRERRADTCAMLAIGTRPARLALARSTVVAGAVAVAARCTGKLALARRARIKGWAVADAVEARAAAVAIAGAHSVAAIGTPPAGLTLARSGLQIAGAMLPAPLRRQGRGDREGCGGCGGEGGGGGVGGGRDDVGQESVGPRASRLRTVGAIPARAAHTPPVLAALPVAGAATGAHTVGAIRALPPAVACALPGPPGGRLRALAVARAVTWADGQLTSVARVRWLARARCRPMKSVDEAGGAAIARGGAGARRPLARLAGPAR